MAADKVYYIWGEEEYLVESELKNIVQQISIASGEEPEKVSVDADELDAFALAQVLEFSPLFAADRVVIIRRPGWLGKSYRKAKKIDDICRVLSDAIENNDQQTIIITSIERNASNPVAKLLEKKAKVIHCQRPEGKQLSNWISHEFTRWHHTATPGAVSMLTKSGLDMFYLQSLIEKLCLMTDNEVTDKEVQEQYTLKQDTNVFKLSDALINRDLRGAMKALDQLIVQGEHPVYLLYMLIRQFFLLAQVKYHCQNGLNASQIAGVTGQKEFAVRRMMDKSSRFTDGELRQAFKSLLEADVSFKTSSKNPDIIMELLLTDICVKK